MKKYTIHKGKKTIKLTNEQIMKYQNFDKLFANINKNIKNNGLVLFTHRIDLWRQQDFLSILKKHQKSLKINKISRPLNYLPLNNDFKNKIKIKIVLLQKQ